MEDFRVPGVNGWRPHRAVSSRVVESDFEVQEMVPSLYCFGFGSGSMSLRAR